MTPLARTRRFLRRIRRLFLDSKPVQPVVRELAEHNCFCDSWRRLPQDQPNLTGELLIQIMLRVIALLPSLVQVLLQLPTLLRPFSIVVTLSV